jgi:hypothetical protein
VPTSPARGSYTFKPYSQTLVDFKGNTAPAVVDWSIDPDALMMVTSGHVVLRVSMGKEQGGVDIVGIKVPAGVTMTARRSHVTAGHPGSIDVAAGGSPGFYKFTVTGKTASGQGRTR